MLLQVTCQKPAAGAGGALPLELHGLESGDGEAAMRKLLVVLTLLSLAACGDRQQERPVEGGEATGAATLVDPGRVDAALKGFIDRGELVGVSALVFEHGREVYFGAHGMADREAGRPMRRDTLVRIYSMTKPITGVTLMTLYDDGLFALDDPLHKYLPEYAAIKVYAGGEGENVELVDPARPLKIHDIMRHTAGFTNGDPRESAWLAERWRETHAYDIENTLEELSIDVASVPLLFEPGARWLYGISVDVQARLVEVLAGKPYEEVLQERVLGPLAMNDTQYTLREDQLDRISGLYDRQPDGTFVRFAEDEAMGFNGRDWPLTPGGWGLTSTLDDYMRFARMLQNEGELDGVRILKAETVRLMATDALPETVADRSWLPNKGRVGFGIDFAVRVAPPANRAETSGAVGEFFWDGLANTLFWVDPQNDITAVLFNIYRPWGKVEIQKDFRDAVYYRDPVASALNKPEAPPGTPRLSD